LVMEERNDLSHIPLLFGRLGLAGTWPEPGKDFNSFALHFSSHIPD